MALKDGLGQPRASFSGWLRVGAAARAVAAGEGSPEGLERGGRP